MYRNQPEICPVRECIAPAWYWVQTCHISILAASFVSKKYDIVKVVQNLLLGVLIKKTLRQHNKQKWNKVCQAQLDRLDRQSKSL